MGTYADAITLLMAFFVLFFSISKVDLDVMDEVAKGMSSAIAKETKETKQETMTENLKEIISSEGADEVVTVGTDAQGSITLELNSGAFFKPGSAELQDQAIPVLKQMFEEIASPIYSQFNLKIEGHTDDDPINTPKFPSNWELSGGRASTVVRFFEAAGEMGDEGDDKIASNRMQATGYAHTQPKVPNRDLTGQPIPANQMANRRIIIRVNRQPVFNKVNIPKFRRPENPDTDPKSKDATK
jgi:chemotaxis protein MotB|tara:strand:- start:2575 stop:3300 length:726 start_codon:yes stop_codon:yes gene_type:complete